MTNRRVLISGDRKWTNYQVIYDRLRYWHVTQGVVVVVEGEARGGDTMGRLAAEALGIPVLKFKADWEKHGKAAGPIRNRKQLKEGQPDLHLAFHNDIASSKGTKDMVKLTMKAGIETHVYTEQGEVNVRIVS